MTFLSTGSAYSLAQQFRPLSFGISHGDVCAAVLFHPVVPQLYLGAP
jgi:hypothetical protein